MARVYSYIRFSTPEQAEGTSLARQLEYASRYADEHGYVLDESLSLRDEGLSAYHQRHIKQGALGVFLRAVDDNLVPSGAVLIIEALDRLSRAEPIVAQALLSQIINAGITVVTASDGKEYSRESLRANPMDLVYSLLVMIRAHEESDTKSKRVSAALRLQCEAWRAGTCRGHIRNGRPPQWLEETGNKEAPLYRLVPERVEALRLALDLYRQGYGGGVIADRLNSDGLSYTGRPVRGSHFYKILKRSDLFGAKLIEVEGESYELDGYYPAVMSRDEWELLQGKRRTRKKAPASDIPGVITGIGLCRCGYCGASMNGVNYVGKAKKAGVLHEGWRRLICARHTLTNDCAVGSSTMLGPIERAVINYCRDKIDLSVLAEQSDVKPDLIRQVAELDARIDEIAEQIDRLTSALLMTDTPPLALMKKQRELEVEQQGLEQNRERLKSDLIGFNSEAGRDLLAEWRALSVGLDTLDYDARMTLRQLVQRTFERIDVYVKGIDAVPPGASAQVAALLLGRLGRVDNPVDLVLKFRSGSVRVMRVNGKTGEWIAQVDV